MSVGILGSKALIKNLKKAKDAANKAAEQEVNRARLAVETTAKQLIARGPKTGNIYPRGGGKFHQASAPGQPPATDTGTLVSSIESKIEIHRPGVASAVVWTEKDYGKFLEFGTKDIEPRPWLTPAVEQNRERFPEALGKAVIRGINQAVVATNKGTEE